MNDQPLKFLFVGLMVVLAFIGRSDRDNLQRTGAQENIQDTSLTAAARPQFSYARPAMRPSRDFSETVPPPVINENLIYRANWDLPDPPLKAKAALAKLWSPEFDFYRFNTGDRWPLASLTKLMTAVVALEEAGQEKIAAISLSAVATEGPAGNLEVGEEYSVRDLMKAMLVVSSNDAAAAIAEFYGQEQFINRMNVKAALLGMRQTSFADPTGISFLNQGTAEDLEKLVKYIYEKHPELLEITRQKSVRILDLSKNSEKELLNINNFAFNGHPDFVGGKTGFTDEAGGNLLSIFDHQGKKVLVIVFGTEDRFGETEKLYNWVQSAFAF